MGVAPRPLLKAIASESIAKLTSFELQSLANTAWSFATLGVYDGPLLDSISAQAIARLSQFDAQSLANTAFAFAALYLWNREPLVNAISAASTNMLRAASDI